MRDKVNTLKSNKMLLYGLVLMVAVGSIFSYAASIQVDKVFVGTITGNVYRDLNTNGIKDPGEPGLANIDVEITDVNGVIQTVFTGPNGNWTAVVPSGETIIDIQDFDPDELADPTIEWPTILDDDFPQPGLRLTGGTDPKTVNVTNNTTINTGRVGYAILGCLTGHVYLDENNNGVQDGDEPDVEGASIIIDPSDSAIEDFIVTTDENGDWTACTIPGQVSVSVVQGTGNPQIVTGSTITQGANPSQTILIAGTTIENGDDNNGDGIGDALVGFFPPEFGLLNGIVFNDLNFNGIQDLNEPGIADVSVIITGISNPSFPITSIDTNSDGFWEIELPPGTYDSDVVEGTVDVGCDLQLLRSVDSDTENDTVFDDETTFAGFDGFFCPEPSISIQKFGDYVDTNGDGGVTVGDAIEYTFTVTNNGNRPLFNISINDVLVSVSGGPISLDIEESDSTTFTAIYFLTVNDIENGEVCNTATALGFTPEGFEVEDTVENVCTATENLCQTSLVKQGVLIDNGDGIITTEDTIEYTFEVTNTGDQVITGVNITDAMLGLSNTFVSPSTLSPGQTGTLGPITYNILQADIDAGEVFNEAEANWDCQTGQNADPSTDDVTVPLVIEPELTLTKGGQFIDDGDGILDTDDTILYTFSVTNAGNVTITGAVINDPLIDSTNPIAGPFDISVGTTLTFTATYSITAEDINAGVVCNSATVEGQTPTGEVVEDVSDSINAADDTGAGDDITCTPLPPVGELNLIKTGVFVDNGDGIIDTNDTIEYTFTVENIGNFPLFNVEVVDNDINQTIFVASVMQPNQTLQVTASYNITAQDIADEVFCNLATVNAETSENTPVSDSDVFCTPIVLNPGISIVKTGEYIDDGNGIFNAGDTIEYTFVVVNTGNVNLINAEIDDPLFDTNPIFGPFDINSDSTETFTISYTITQDDIDQGFVTNTACVNAITPTGDGVGSCSTEVITFENFASIELIKGVTYVDANNDGIINAGDELSYDFTVTNTGDLEVTNISIDDTDIGQTGITVTPANLDQGESGTASATYILTQEDIDLGEFCNSATAVGSSSQGTVTDVSDSVNPLDGAGDDDETCWYAAAISIVKSGVLVDANNDGIVNIGDQISYNFIVTNIGSEDLENIQVSDPLLGGNIGGTFGLSVGEDSEIENVLYNITQADLDAGQVCNTASVNGTSNPSGVAVEAGSNQVCTHLDGTFTSSIELVKSGTLLLGADDILNPGDEIQYTFTVTNNGGTLITDVILNDATIGFTNISVSSSLVPGQSAEVSTSAADGTNYIITQADIDAGEFCNQASAEGVNPQGDMVFASDDLCIPLVLISEVVLEKGSLLNDENNNGLTEPGETITYTFTVINTGTAPLTDVVVLDVLFGVADDVIEGPFDLAAGQSFTFTETYAIEQEDIDTGQVINTALIIGNYLDTTVQDVSDSTNDNDDDGEDDPTITPLLIQEGLELLKSGVYEDTDDNGMVNIGDQINYQFTLTNTGNTTLFDVIIDDIDDINVSIEVGTLGPGETFTSDEVLYNIIQADLQAGEKVNSATANGVNLNGDAIQDISDSTNPLDDTGEDDDPTVVTLDVPDDVIFYNGITPNGDGVNDVLIIENIENFPNNSLKIFNRWGVLVYEAEAYGSIKDAERVEFDGTSDGRITIAQGEKLPTGTYIYIFEYVDFLDRTQELTGFIYINAD